MTLVQVYGIERRLEMVQLYLGSDPIICSCFNCLKRSTGWGRNSLYDLSDTEEAPWNALGCVHITPLESQLSLSLTLCVPFILFIQVLFTPYWSDSQYVLPPFFHIPQCVSISSSFGSIYCWSGLSRLCNVSICITCDLLFSKCLLNQGWMHYPKGFQSCRTWFTARDSD